MTIPKPKQKPKSELVRVITSKPFFFFVAALVVMGIIVIALS